MQFVEMQFPGRNAIWSDLRSATSGLGLDICRPLVIICKEALGLGLLGPWDLEVD